MKMLPSPSSTFRFLLRRLLVSSLLLLFLRQPAIVRGQEDSTGQQLQDWNPRTTLCDRFESALGLESGALADSSISASSSYNEQSVGPTFARLNHDVSGGAWCPAPQLDVKVSGSEWLQINLTHRHVITGVSTQGRFGNGLGVEYVEEFWIEYSRDSGQTWHKWKNRKGSHLLQGNADTYSIKHNQLELPIVGANVIRIVPYSQHMRTVCLRAELFGCPYEGPTLYQMPDGFFGGRFGDLIDDSYDGTRDKSGYLSHGLGQLGDGIKGTENYKLNSGFEWIGWKAHNDTVEIVFTFATLRNFTSASFHCHNLYRKSVEVFGSARVYFSFDGSRWSKSPTDFEYMPDHVMETPRDVVIHLNHRIARHVRFSLKFAAKWLLISEVSFNSEAVFGDYNENIDDLESLEVAQEAVEPPIFQGKSSSLAFVFIFLGVVLTCLAILVALVGLVYQVYLRRQKAKGGNFYEVDVDFAIAGSPGDLHRQYLHQGHLHHNQGNGGGGGHHINNLMHGVMSTPVYCEPDHEVWRGGSGGGGGGNSQTLTAAHEYAVPDVIYQNNGSGGHKVSNSQHRLISNPLREDDQQQPCESEHLDTDHDHDDTANDNEEDLNDMNCKEKENMIGRETYSSDKAYRSATSPGSGVSETMALLTRNNLFASARAGLLLSEKEQRSRKLYPNPYIIRDRNDYTAAPPPPTTSGLDIDFAALARSPGRSGVFPPPPPTTPSTTSNNRAPRDASLNRSGPKRASASSRTSRGRQPTGSATTQTMRNGSNSPGSQTPTNLHMFGGNGASSRPGRPGTTTLPSAE